MLVGRSNPDRVDDPIRQRTPDDADPFVGHLYQVIHRGSSAIDGATLDIFWPSFSENGKPLLRLTEPPYISDHSKARCQVKQGGNVADRMRAAAGHANKTSCCWQFDFQGVHNRSDLTCHTLNCTHITCDIDRLEKDDFIIVETWSRLRLDTLIEDNIYEMDITSLAFAQITSYANDTSFTAPFQAIAVTTFVRPANNLEPDPQDVLLLGKEDE
ncbi:integrin alpha pat-2 [Aphelenchoides avenae]|nr:integrin alpha pat-2 [Aphelenchus avenae]